MKTYRIGENPLSISDVSKIIQEGADVVLSISAKKKIKRSKEFLDLKVKNSNKPIYGINTGFGSLCNHKIDNNKLSELQYNLVVSHACGTGEEVPKELVKIMLLLKVQSLSLGHSGVQLETVNRLIEMFNNNILPVVYQQGSLGSSGDLAPLAHLSLPIIGIGEVDILDNTGKFKRFSSKKMLKRMSWNAITLQSKEGLALLNGTQFMAAYGVWCLIKAQKISYYSDLIASISIDAFDARGESFDELLHLVRPHDGQIKTAANIREFLIDSKIQKQEKKHVQDPYSFRCIPQVHGATKGIISHVSGVFTTEINSVTDNPTIFIKEDKIISGGNFHGQPLSMALDYLAIGLSELGSISERRIFHLISGTRGLPPFLIANPGINSGMMIPQYTAASIASQNKQLCTPASVDSIVSSNGQEDHVSMGANAATKLYKVVENIERILAIELMNATQALAFRNIKSSNFIESILDIYRDKVDFLDKDRLMRDDIEKSIDFISDLNIDDELL